MGLIRSWWETPSVHWRWLKGERSMRRRWWSRGTYRGSFTWHNETDLAESPHHCWCFSCPDTPFPLTYSTIKSQFGNISFVKRGWHQGLYVLDRPTDHIWDQWNAAVSTTLMHQSNWGMATSKHAQPGWRWQPSFMLHDTSFGEQQEEAFTITSDCARGQDGVVDGQRW